MSDATTLSRATGPDPQQHSGGPRCVVTRTWVTVSLLVVYTLVVLVVTLTPSLDTYHVDAVAHRVVDAGRHAGLSKSFGINRLSLIMNVLMFIPLGMLAGLVFGRRRIWILALAVLVFSALIEWTQGTFLPGRMADVGDIVANSIGGWIGLAAAAVVQNALERRAVRRSGERR